MYHLAVSTWRPAVCVIGLWAAVFVPHAQAVDGFRVDSRVYYEDQKEPACQSSTIFADRMVYDFLDKPAEICVFDRPRGQFILLNTERRISTRVAIQDVASFTDQLQGRAESQADPFLKFLAQPKFEQHLDPASGTLTMNSLWMSYRVEAAAPPNPAMLAEFREFSDWYVRLTPILDSAARPPFARMLLNESLERSGLMPRKVTLTLAPKRGIMAKRIVVRSEHQLIDRLSESDNDRLVQTQQFVTIFNPVGLEQYRK
jgi:hypothetical protein